MFLESPKSHGAVEGNTGEGATRENREGTEEK